VIIYLVRPKNGLLCQRELVRAFAEPAAAEEHVRDLDRQGIVPQDMNPFLAVRWKWERLDIRGRWYPPRAYETLDVSRVTSFPEPILHDWVLDCGLTPPQSVTVGWKSETGKGTCQVRDWYLWWHTNLRRMCELQRRHVRRALDKVQLFEVISLELEE
jgi:hypothetical protein